MNKNILFFTIAFFVVLFDQLTKYFVRQKLVFGKSIPVLDHIIYLTYIKNRGAAFGILQNGRILFIVIGVVSLLIILYFFHFFTSSNPLLIGGSLLFGGIIGNLLDRIFLGYVTDFMHFRFWPVFNIADSCVDVGLLIVVVYLLFFYGRAHS